MRRCAADVAVGFMTTADQREALLEVSALTAQLESLRLRLIASADGVAAEEGMRDIAAWLTHHTRGDRSSDARALRLADALAGSWPGVAQALAEGAINLDQARVLVRALDDLPSDVGPGVLHKAESTLVEDAGSFGPRELRILGRRVLDVVAPELGEEQELRALAAEERGAERATSLTTHRSGDGVTLVKVRVPDAAADRLLTYLHAFTSPRQRESSDPDHLPHDRRLGQAFCALLEHLDPSALPAHGGDATTVLVTIDLATLVDGLGTAALGGDTQITAAEARRLACTANVVPLVLGGKSEILDQGRAKRLFSPAQRKALAVRDRVCRAQGCEVPAAWCEAHHFGRPWAEGGKTDLAAGKLLCSWHHHRAHNERYLHVELPNGDVRFHRRR